MLKEGCNFCYEQPWTHFKKLGTANLSDFVIAESKHWVAKPDVLPAQKDGLHFVMRPKNHSINAINEDPHELGQFLHEIEQKYGPMAIMKHGDTKEESASVMSVRHDHTHLFPGVDINTIDYMRDIIDKQGIPYKIIDTPDPSYLVGLRKQFEGHPYMYLQQGRVGLFVNDEHELLGTQQVQRAMQKHFNGQTFNWKEITSKPEYQKLSAQRITNLIERHGK